MEGGVEGGIVKGKIKRDRMHKTHPFSPQSEESRC